MGIVRRVHPAVGTAVLVLAVRLLVALSRIDEWFGEEVYAGSIAWALLKGMPLDPERLPVIVHLRGSFIFALLLVPLHALLGPSILSLRLLAVLWAAASGALFALLLARRVGRSAAWTGGVLYALLPPAFQMIDVLALGSHVDFLLPVLGALCVLLWRPGPLTAGRALAFGLLAGVSITFSFHGLVVLPALALAWILQDRRAPLRRSSALAAVGLALGLAPIPLLSSQSTKLVTAPMESHVLPAGVGGAFEKLGWTLAEGFPRSLLFEDSGGMWLGWLWVAAATAGLLLLAPRLARGEPLAAFALAYPVLLLAAYAASDFELNLEVRGNGIGSRYLLPMLPFLAAWVALGAALLARRGLRAAAAGLVLATALPGAAGAASLLDPAKAWRLPPVRGTIFAFLGNTRDHLSYAEPDWRERIELARRVDPDWDAYRPLAYEVLHPPVLPPPRAAVQRLPELAPDHRPFVVAEVGRRAASAGPEAVAEAVAAAAEAGESGVWLLRGLGAGIAIREAGEYFVSRGARGGFGGSFGDLPPEAAPVVAEGAGFRIGIVLTPYNERLSALARTAGALPPALRDAFYRGLALGFRTRFREDRWFVPQPGSWGIEAAVPPAARDAFQSGLAAPLDRFGVS